MFFSTTEEHPAVPATCSRREDNTANFSVMGSTCVENVKNVFVLVQEVSRAEARAQLLSERVAGLFQHRRSERLARSACRAWFGYAQQAGEARENARLAGLWHRRQSLKSGMTRWGARIAFSGRPVHPGGGGG